MPPKRARGTSASGGNLSAVKRGATSASALRKSKTDLASVADSKAPSRPASRQTASAASPRKSGRRAGAKKAVAGAERVSVDADDDVVEDKKDEEVNDALSGAGSSSTTTKGKAAAKGAAEGEIAVFIPTEEQLLQSKRLQAVADQLSHSLIVLRTKLTTMEQRIAASNAAVEATQTALPGKPGSANSASSGSSNPPAAVPLLPFQIRRAQLEKEQLEQEILQTTRIIRKLLIMSQQVEAIMSFKDVVFRETKKELEEQIASLMSEKAANVEVIREGFIGRINLLHRYWPWRRLLDLGDTCVGGTFEEELERGPRYRHVGIQNSIESDYIETQLRWLEKFSDREETFRNHLRRLDALVEDLNDINDLLESTLTCQVCTLLFEDPVILWPCGHTFCLVCFSSLMIAPSLFRCPICGSIGSEGYVHNLLIGETVAKWMFKDSGYDNLQEPLNNIRVHLSRFRKDKTEDRIKDLKELLKQHKANEKSKGTTDAKTISVSYRAY